MDATRLTNCYAEVEDPAAPALSVLLVYEDSVTGLRAKHSLDALPDHLRMKSAIATSLWRCDLLKAVWLREQAALEAAAADVIIISLHALTELPDEVREWLNRWLVHKEDRPCALGVLLDGDRKGRSADHSVAAYVQKYAEAADADFFYGYCEGTDGQPIPPRQGLSVATGGLPLRPRTKPDRKSALDQSGFKGG
jgi:hypothetical protein